MSALADEHVQWLNVMARNAGMLSQPMNRGWPERHRPPRNLELEREFFADAVDTSAERVTEGEAVRAAWEAE